MKMIYVQPDRRRDSDDTKGKGIKVYFEVTNCCNFNCDFCLIESSRRKRQHIEFSLLKKSVDEIARDKIADTIGFYVLGEPLLYPNLLKALEYARQKDLRTEATTNGSLLITERAVVLAESVLGLLTKTRQIPDRDKHPCLDINLPYESYHERIITAVRVISERGTGTDIAIATMNATTKKLLDIDKPMRLDGSGRSFERRLGPLVNDLCAATGNSVDLETVKRNMGKLNLAGP